MFVLLSTFINLLVHLVFYESIRNEPWKYLDIYFGWSIEFCMCAQLIYDYCDFGNQIKQWEYEYFRDSEVRKQKVLNQDGLNENKVQEEVGKIIKTNPVNNSRSNSIASGLSKHSSNNITK